MTWWSRAWQEGKELAPEGSGRAWDMEAREEPCPVAC